MITFLSRPEMDAILAAPDRRSWLGSRDHAFLLTMYNSGARCSELMQLKCGQVSFGSPTLIHLHGKGRKDRTVPLWPQTTQVLRKWFQILSGDENGVAFPSVRKAALTADGVDYLIQRAVAKAVQTCPELVKKRITPHTLRHASAYYTTFQSSFILKTICLDQGQSAAVYGRHVRLALVSARSAN